MCQGSSSVLASICSLLLLNLSPSCPCSDRSPYQRPTPTPYLYRVLQPSLYTKIVPITPSFSVPNTPYMRFFHTMPGVIPTQIRIRVERIRVSTVACCTINKCHRCKILPPPGDLLRSLHCVIRFRSKPPHSTSNLQQDLSSPSFYVSMSSFACLEKATLDPP
jgi:hypothetical protein